MKYNAVAFIAVALVAMAMMTNTLTIRPMPKSPVGTCPIKDGEFPVYLADSSNCQIFYECSAGNATEKQCMQGLCFDPQLNVCAFPTTNDTNPAELSEISVYTPVGACPPRDTNLTIFLPDSDNCTVYYLCSNGVAIQNLCPPDMSWNVEKNTCDWEVDVGCLEGKVQDISFYSPVGTCPPRDTNVTIFLPDSDNCTLYYLCSNGNAIQNSCPPEMSWNTEKNICDWTIDTDCQAGNATARGRSPRSAVGECPPKDPATPVYLPDSERCDIYYECSGGIAFQNDCPPDLEFNPILKICDFPLDAGCNGTHSNSTQPPATSSTTSGPTTASTTTSTTKSPMKGIY